MIDYSTYARAVISDNDTISKLILKHSTTTAAPDETEVEPKGLLSNEQLFETLQNPQNAFILGDIKAYAHYLRLRRQLDQTLDEIKQQQSLILEALKRLKINYKDAAASQKESIGEHLRRLEEALKNIIDTQKQLEPVRDQLATYENELDTMATEQDDNWNDYRQRFLQQSREAIEENDCPLNESEVADLLRHESLQELILRFDTNNLPLPKGFNQEKLRYSTYFYLKAYLAIHASLGRRMLPNTPQDVEKFL